MKYLYLLGLLSIISFSSIGQSKEQQAIANAVEKLRKAMIDGDKLGLENLTADSLSYGHSSGKVENKTEFVENIASGKSDFVTIEISEQTITIQNNVAIVRHVLNGTNNDGGKPGVLKLRVMLIWEKEKTGWKLLARQAIKIV